MLPHYLAAPTLITLGGVPHLADRLRLGDFALLLQAAADSLGRSIDDDPSPRFSDSDIGGWIDGDGLPLVVWMTLRRHWPELRLENAYDLAGRLSEDEVKVVTSAAYRFGKRKDDEPGESVDLALLKWGRFIRWFADNGKGLPPQLAEYTLDQVDLLVARDDPEAAREAAEKAEGWAAFKAMFDEAQAAKNMKPPETIADLGYAILPGQEISGETNPDVIEHEVRAESGPEAAEAKPARPRRARRNRKAE